MAVVTVRPGPVSKFSGAIETLHTHIRVRAEFGILCSRTYDNILKGAKRLKRCAIKLEYLLKVATASPGAGPGTDLGACGFSGPHIPYPVLPGF